MLSTLQNNVSMTSLRYPHEFLVAMGKIYDVTGAGTWQKVYAMLCHYFFSITIQTEIILTVISDFRKQTKNILKSFNLVFRVNEFVFIRKQIKLLKILQELAESEPKACPKHQRER